MGVQLDPTVVRKLSQFRRRRLRLIVARGICAGILAFVIGMSVVALIDWYWLLADSTRWYLSGGAYLTVVVAIWMTSLRSLLHLPAQEEIAVQMELTEPALRENLLSAVELAIDDPAAIHDSPVFRGLLQGEVARQMRRIQVPGLLPFRLVAKWVATAVVLVAVAAWLLFSDDSRFGQLAVRAVLPGANIARISRIHVDILEPTPHSLLLAEDETVAVVVAVSGGRVDEVTLETLTPAQGTVRHTMRGDSEAGYALNIPVGDESIEYRILAGDAVTERFRIESRPRPRVTAFHKHFDYPEYARLPPETVTETHGDLLVLEGTRTRLVLDLDQPVATAELRIDASDSESVRIIPLTPVTSAAASPATIQWQADLPIDAPALYKVHLVSAESGFENVFSPKFEIRPLPDLIPRAGFVNQQETTLLLPPSDILALQGMAEDDLPVVGLEQQFSVNGREWASIPLETAPDDETGGRRIAAVWQWDLLHHKLQTGDQVLTKLVATDRKGNKGESIPLRIVVAAQDFDPERHAVMERKLGLYDELAAFAALLREQQTSALATLERLRQLDRTEIQQQTDRTILLDLASRQRERAGLLLEAVTAVEHTMPAGADAWDLDLTGRVIARIEREHSNVPAYLLTAMQHADADGRKADLDELKRNLDRAVDDAVNLANHYQVLMSHNLLAAVASDLDALLQQQQYVVDSPTQTWDRLLRQETLVINQLRVLERVVADQRMRLPQSLDDQLRKLLTWAETQRSRLQDATESEDKLNELRNVSKDFLRQLADRQRVDVIEGNLPGRIVNVRKDFLNRAGSLYVPIDQLGQATRQENRLAALAADAPDSAESQTLLAKAARYTAEIDLRDRRSFEQLRARRELTQSRPDADSQFAADVGLTLRAVTWLLDQHRQTSPRESTIPEHLLEVAPAYRTLEAGHELVHARDALNRLLGMERWESQSFHSHIDNPRQWDVVQQGLEVASERLQQAGVDRAIVDRLNQIRWSEPVREAGRKISERRWRREAMIAAGHELAVLRKDLVDVVADVDPVLAEARAVIARYAPTIPQMAQQAAVRLRVLEEQTQAAADAAEAARTPETVTPQAAPQLAELGQQQDAVNQQIGDLLEALIEDANTQDLLDAEQRERARDVDASRAMIEEPAARMNQALQQAQQQAVGEQQARELARAAEQQEQTAQALELVANHFGRLNAGQDVAQSRAELRQAEQELGIARQMEQRFESTTELAQMANQDGAQLLSELEAELARNPAMQQALSEIARNTLQEARNSLQYAAQDEQEVQRANERSDAAFQARKRELAEDLRQMGAEASRLANELIAQAEQAANQGKTPEAQQRLDETQQQLSVVAAQAGSAREEQLLADLAETARQAQSALLAAAQTLQQARQQTQAGKDAQIHADEKAREAQQKAFERSRQQFQDQQKRSAASLAKQADDQKRRADQNAKNAAGQVQAAERRVQQAQNNLDRKPEDAGLQAALAREQSRLTDELQKLAQSQQGRQRAEQSADRARRQADAVNQRAMPPLNAANPATQLADLYTAEAIKLTDDLNRRAGELAAAAQFGGGLTPPQEQLASASERQGQVTEDVQQAADDVARAARHERRLQNSEVAAPLQQAAEAVEQVARKESTVAEHQLQAAVSEAQRAAAENAASQNAQALQAQTALATAESAIARQAEQLTGVLDPLLAAAEQTDGQPGESQAGESPAAVPGDVSGSSPQGIGEPPAGSPAETAGSSPLPGGLSTPSISPAELARGQQLARTLDELDRQAAAAAATGQSGPQSQPAARESALVDSLAQAAQAQRSALAAARASEQAQQSPGEGTESSDNPAFTGAMTEFGVQPVNRDEATDWGKLRSKSAEDLTAGRKEDVAEEYRQSVEAYFRVLAERARKNPQGRP